MKEFYEEPEFITPDMEAELIFIPPEGTPFWKKLLTYCFVWLVVIIIACGLMWTVLDQYEASLPETAMDEYILTSRQDMFFFAISALYDKIDNRFENAYDSASAISKNFNGALTYEKFDSEYTDETPVYIIRHNGEDLFKVTLEHDEETGFMKYKDYAVNRVELLNSEFLTHNSYKLVFASNMLININSTSLGTELDEFEKVDTFGGENYYGVVINDFIIEPEIVALMYKNTYSEFPDKVVTAKRVNNYYIFERDDDQTYTLTITVPANATVQIDGAEVADSFVTKRFTEGDAELKVYTVPTVFSHEEVTAAVNGRAIELVNDGYAYTAQ